MPLTKNAIHSHHVLRSNAINRAISNALGWFPKKHELEAGAYLSPAPHADLKDDPDKCAGIDRVENGPYPSLRIGEPWRNPK